MVDPGSTGAGSVGYGREWLVIALTNFLIAALLGALLRYAFIEEISWIPYRNVLHGHSHLAMLGWLYMALYALLIHCFGTAATRSSRLYHRLFWVTQASIAGMLVSFLIQGYGAVAISFSVMHIACSYVFVYKFWSVLALHKTVAAKFARTALVFMLLSTLGVWATGVLVSMDLRGSALYYMSVQYYLHFQFNGWFLFAVLALFFHLLAKSSVVLPRRQVSTFFMLLTISCLLTYALAVTWSNPVPAIFMVNSAGVIVQSIALIYFARFVWKFRGEILAHLDRLVALLLSLAFLSLIMKWLVQAMVILPWIAQVGYTIRNYVISFLHLILIGVMTCFVIGYGLHSRLFTSTSRLAKPGLWLLLGGFIGSEFLLVIQGSMFWAARGFMPFYYEILFGVSAAMPLGVFCLLLSQLRLTGGGISLTQIK